jgi:glycosyltransferase involved in cell wall biosynthesis
LKIIFIIQWLRTGGAEKQLVLLAKGLSDIGYNCEICTLQKGTSNTRLENLIKSATASGVIFNRPRKKNLLRHYRLLHKLVNLNNTIVWAWGLRSELLCKLAKIINNRFKLICSLRSANYCNIRKRLYYTKFLINKTDFIVSNSDVGCRILKNLLPENKSKIKVLYNTTESTKNTNRYLPKPETLRIVMLGNIRIRAKGYDLVPDIYKKLKKYGVKSQFHISGRLGKDHNFVNIIKHRSLCKVIKYHGIADDPEKFLKSGHVFLLASRYEGMPNALFEAMGLGMPCVSTRVGDVGKLVENNVHLKVANINDAQSIAYAIKELYFNWDKSIEMAKRGKEFCIMNLSYSAYIKNASALIKNIGTL